MDNRKPSEGLSMIWDTLNSMSGKTNEPQKDDADKKELEKPRCGSKIISVRQGGKLKGVCNE